MDLGSKIRNFLSQAGQIVGNVGNSVSQAAAPVVKTFQGFGQNLNQNILPKIQSGINTLNNSGLVGISMPNPIGLNLPQSIPGTSPFQKEIWQPVANTIWQGANAGGRLMTNVNPLNQLLLPQQTKKNLGVGPEYFKSGQAKSDLLSAAKGTAAGVGIVTAPEAALGAGVFGGAIKSIENLAKKRPILENVPSAVGEGVDFGAILGPLGKVAELSPTTDFAGNAVKKFVPDMGKFGDVLSNVAKGVSKEALTGAGYGTITGQNPLQTAVQFAPYGLMGAGGEVKTGGKAAVEIKNPMAEQDVKDTLKAIDTVFSKNANEVIQNGGKSESFLRQMASDYIDPKFASKAPIKDVANELVNRINVDKSYDLAGLGFVGKNTKMDNLKAQIPGEVPPGMKERGFVTSVQESPNVTNPVKADVSGIYKPKPNTQLMGEAKTLLQELPEGSKIDFKNVQNIDQKVAATIQEAINQDKLGNHDAAANLYNNLARHGTELGRGVQAFSLLDKMSPEAIAKSAAARIQQYNASAARKLPELTGDQEKMISDSVNQIDALSGREKNIAINKLQTMINEWIPSSLTDKGLTVWKAGLLTSLRTHERNLIGNSIMAGFEGAKDFPAAIADRLMGLKTENRSMTMTLKGTGEGTLKGLQAAKDIMKTGFDPEEAISKFDVHQITWGKNPVEQGLKKYTDFVFRTLGGEDKPFWNASFARSLYDQAGAEAINAGKQGDKAFIENLVKSPNENMVKTATVDANYATFHDASKLSTLANAFKQWAGKEWYTKLPAEIIAPFTGVPSSIVGKTVAYSPIGFVKGAIDVGRVLLGKTPIPELQRQAAQEVGRGVMGSALFGLGAYLMSKGLMTGQPKDTAEARQWQLENKPSNSAKGPDGRWYSINSIGPQNLVMLAGAKYAEEMGPNGGGVGAFAGQLAKDQLSQTFLAGVQGPLNAITDPARYGSSYIGNQVASAVPNIIKDASKALDPYARETNSTMDYVKNSFPVVRNQSLPKRDALGNIVPQEPTGAAAFFDVFNSKTPIDNPVVNELSRLNSTGNNATPGTIGKSQTINGVKQTLTPDQINLLESQVGPQAMQQLQGLFNSGDYRSLSDEEKNKAVGDIMTAVRKQVRGTIDLTQPAPDTSGLIKSALAAPPDMIKSPFTNGKYVLVNQDTGAVKSIDLSKPITKPELTGDYTIDKRLKAKYNSEVTSRINDIVSLQQDKQLTLDQAKSEIAKLQKDNGSGKTLSPSQLKTLTLKSPKVTKMKLSGLKLKNLSKSLTLNTPIQRAFSLKNNKLSGLKGSKMKLIKQTPVSSSRTIV